MLTLHRHLAPSAFRARAEAWLLQHEAEHNLILGLTRSMADDAAVYLATVEDDGAVLGCAMRTPPHKLLLTRMPVEAAPLLAADVATQYDTLPAALGPEAPTRAFAAAWMAEHPGVRATPGLRQGIYQLTQVVPPSRLPRGQMRLAADADTPQVAAWLRAFYGETGLYKPDPNHHARSLITSEKLYLWTRDGAAVTMAGCTGETPHGIRIGYVYTPASHRRQGYASALVAALSQHLLASGHRFCFLYTDLGNPTSNALYQRLGYQWVCEVMDYDFG